MKQTRFLIPTLLLILTLFLSSGFAQDYVYYKKLMGPSPIGSVVFSLDGQTLANGHDNGTIHLWDAATGAHKSTFTGHTHFVNSVMFSPDGSTLASGGHDETIRLWDTITGTHLRTLTGHTHSVNSVVFSPDGSTLASGSRDETIRLWDAITGTHLRTLTGHTHSVNSVVFSPDGSTLASGSWDTTVRLWDIATGKHLRTFTGHKTIVYSVVFSPDGQTLASNSSSTLKLWDVGTGGLKKTITGDIGGNVTFSPDGQMLVWTYMNKIHLSDARTITHKQTLTGHAVLVTSLAFSPDGQMLAGGSVDSTVSLWKLAFQRSFRSIPTDRSTPPKSTADQVYDNAIRSVMWIVNSGISEGSGVLFDKQFKLAVTNAHVTGKQNTINVYFPAPDENGELIKDRNFYLTNSSVLKRLGYYTKGHVVARNEKTDLAIIKLDGLPETAREINWNSTAPATDTGDLVYILGNPGGQDLWRWTLGEFLKDHGDFLHIQSDVFGGNSGGPVLNKQGVLLGIVARSDRHMNALAIPVRHISGLLSKSQLEHSRSRR